MSLNLLNYKRMVIKVEKRVNLNIQEILDKEFHVDIKGYNANEVDAFLDLVIADYQSYDEMNTIARENLKKYEEENRKLRLRIRELELQLSSKDAVANAPVDHLDILKRLSRLEKAVFKDQETHI